MTQESKCKEAESLKEYKKIIDPKIKDQVMNMNGFTLISLFHRRRNTLHKAVHQTVMDEQMAYIKRIQLITKEINYNKDYMGNLGIGDSSLKKKLS